MDQQLKERLIGVTALVLVAIVFIPMFFKKSTDLALREKENVEFINENESEFISKLKPMTETAAIEDNNTQITAVEEQVNKDKVSSKTVEMGQMNWIVQIGSFSSKENAINDFHVFYCKFLYFLIIQICYSHFSFFFEVVSR